jgi:hypothetical protein
MYINIMHLYALCHELDWNQHFRKSNSLQSQRTTNILIATLVTRFHTIQQYVSTSGGGLVSFLFLQPPIRSALAKPLVGFE